MADAARSLLLQDFLRANELAGWFSWRPEELLMQIGVQPYWGLSFLLLLKDDEPILFVPALEPPTCDEGLRIVTYPWGELQCAVPFAVLNQSLDQELSRRHLSRAAIGCMPESSRSSLPCMSAEQPPLPPRGMHALTEGMVTSAHLQASFEKLFLHKTAAEIERIRLANQVAQVGLRAWRNALHPGATEAETAAAAEASIHATIGQPGVESARAWAMVQSGPHTAEAGRFNRSSGRRLQQGEPVLIELATCINGYWSDLTRTEVISPSSPELKEIIQAVSIAQQAAIRAAVPDATAEAVDDAARRSLVEAGFGAWFSHATGHPTGFRYHDSGFALQPGCKDILQPGQVFTIEPGVYLLHRHVGVRIEDNFAIASSGADCLSADTGLLL